MRKQSLVIVAIIVALSSLVFAGTALAKNGPAGSTSSPHTEGGGNGSATHFTAQYFNPLGGNASCSGVRIVNAKYTKDTETCSISDVSSWPAGEYIGDPFYSVNGASYFWISDFDGKSATLFRGKVTDNGNGTGTLELVAIY